jgi:DNA polymerase-3 subunit alpha
MGNFIDKFEDYDLGIHGVRLPNFHVEDKYKRKLGISEDSSNIEFLKSMARKGFKKLGVKKDSKEYKAYQDRARYELETLEELGFIDYILLVWDVVNYCKENDIPIGRGRGSAAGSLILFLIGATGIDPIKYGLYFERFISKIRAKKQVVDGITYLDGSLMCDVDIDVCYYKRQEVLKYLEEKFEGKTSKILTLNTLSGKLLMKECGKIVSSCPEGEMNQVTALIPKTYGIVQDIGEAYSEVKKFKEWCDKNKEAYKIALSLRGLIKNKGVHASAISLSYDKMEDSCPTELSSDKSSVSSYDMNWVSMFNVKLDILGLRSASVVHDVCKRVGIQMTEIDLDDPFIYQNLQDLRTPHGLFQIEADTNYKVCRKVMPKDLSELSAVLALGRPGALSFVDQYASYANTQTYEAIHPFFDDILASTGGVALYQEQLMKMANKIGFTLDEAELLRRIVGKKKTTEVRKWRKKIRDKIKENNLDKEIGKVLWSILEDSANYSFNKSHSIAYAALSASTVYLKFKHPQQFFLSLLKMTRHEPDPTAEISKIEKELQYFGMKLLPPHITRSKMDFSVEGDDIRFGLLSIKGISEKKIEKINSFRDEYSTKFEIFQAASEAKIDIGTLSALIQAGSLEEGFNQSRSKVVLEAQVWNLLKVKERKYCLEFAKKFNYDLIKIIKHLIEHEDEKGKPVIKESRYGTIKKHYKPYLDIFLLNSKSERFANWYYEKILLGYTYNVPLRDIFLEKQPELCSVRDAQEAEIGESLVFAAWVDDCWSGSSKAKGTKYQKLVVSDETGIMNTMIFSKKMEECRLMNDGLAEKRNIVIVRGRKFEDVVFADVIGVQDNKVYTKLSELKKITA